MAICDELADFGHRIAAANLVAGAGGNISARDGDIIWMKPSGFAMGELRARDFAGMRLRDGAHVKGSRKPTSEVGMHLAIYRERPDTRAVFHTHSPWASGVLSSGADLRPMFAEFICDLGRVASIPYVTPTTQDLADAVGKAVRDADTLFMRNHGVLALGVTMKQAFYRCEVVEHAAISMVASAVVGKPRFLTAGEVDDLMKLDAPKHRITMMEEASA